MIRVILSLRIRGHIWPSDNWNCTMERLSIFFFFKVYNNNHIVYEIVVQIEKLNISYNQNIPTKLVYILYF